MLSMLFSVVSPDGRRPATTTLGIDQVRLRMTISIAASTLGCAPSGPPPFSTVDRPEEHECDRDEPPPVQVASDVDVEDPRAELYIRRVQLGVDIHWNVGQLPICVTEVEVVTRITGDTTGEYHGQYDRNTWQISILDYAISEAISHELIHAWDAGTRNDGYVHAGLQYESAAHAFEAELEEHFERYEDDIAPEYRDSIVERLAYAGDQGPRPLASIAHADFCPPAEPGYYSHEERTFDAWVDATFYPGHVPAMTWDHAPITHEVFVVEDFMEYFRYDLATLTANPIALPDGDLLVSINIHKNRDSSSSTDGRVYAETEHQLFRFDAETRSFSFETRLAYPEPDPEGLPRPTGVHELPGGHLLASWTINSLNSGTAARFSQDGALIEADAFDSDKVVQLSAVSGLHGLVFAADDKFNWALHKTTTDGIGDAVSLPPEVVPRSDGDQTPWLVRAMSTREDGTIRVVWAINHATWPGVELAWADWNPANEEWSPIRRHDAPYGGVVPDYRYPSAWVDESETIWFTAMAGIDLAVSRAGDRVWTYPESMCDAPVDFDQGYRSGRMFQWNGEVWGVTLARESSDRYWLPALVRFNAE